METQLPVTERALFARLNRTLKKRGEKLHRCRSDSRWFNDIGPFYVVDVNTNGIIDRGFSNLEEWAREEGVLKPYEYLEADPAELARAEVEIAKINEQIGRLEDVITLKQAEAAASRAF